MKYNQTTYHLEIIPETSEELKELRIQYPHLWPFSRVNIANYQIGRDAYGHEFFMQKSPSVEGVVKVGDLDLLSSLNAKALKKNSFEKPMENRGQLELF